MESIITPGFSHMILQKSFLICCFAAQETFLIFVIITMIIILSLLFIENS